MEKQEAAPLGQDVEGWRGQAADLVELVERAFDYRGDVTVVTHDGQRRVGYLFNRNRDVSDPFLQVLPTDGGPVESVLYGDIASIAFTGHDAANGKSYAAWRKRKEAERAGVTLAPDPASASGG